MNYFEEYPEVQRAVTELTEQTLNSPMILDIKNNPRLADYQFYLDNNPRFIPAAIMVFYTYITSRYPGESLDVNNIISDDIEKNILINFIISEINLDIRNRRILAGEIRDPTNEELVEDNDPGIELRVRPIEAIPEELPIDVNLLPVSARVISNEEKIIQTNLPTASNIEVGGKTKKRINKYKKGKSKTNKTHNKKSKKYKNNKKNRKTMRKKTK
jgi:hypothetical protein